MNNNAQPMWNLAPAWVLAVIPHPAVAISHAGQVLWANPAAMSLATRLNPAAPVLDDLVKLIPQEGVSAAGEEGVWIGDAVSDSPLRLRVNLTRGDDGAIAVFQEAAISADHAAEAMAKALATDRMATIGQLAAGIAHEVNNPISFVRSNLGTLEEYADSLLRMVEASRLALEATGNTEAIEGLKAKRAQLDIDYIADDLPKLASESREGIERVAGIVRDLKDFARSGPARAMEPADLVRGMESTLNILSAEIKYKAEVVRDYGDTPLVECRIEEINQVLLNLVVNASHAIGERGVITVASGAQDGEAWISVSDTGAGIPKDKLAQIFDPYFTTKPAGKGTGIGLAVSYSIVANHNGRIEVSSEPGQGTTFRVVLPVRQAQVACKAA